MIVSVKDRYKAADIPDSFVLDMIDRMRETKHRWTHVQDLMEALPHVPYKVIQAKVRQMISKGRITGCPCGCRGDLERVTGSV